MNEKAMVEGFNLLRDHRDQDCPKVMLVKGIDHPTGSFPTGGRSRAIL